MRFGTQSDPRNLLYFRYEGFPLVSSIKALSFDYRSTAEKRRQSLVDLYKDLLDFYFAAMEILKSGSFFIGLQKSRFKQRLTQIVSSFTGNREQLNQLIDADGYARIQKIDEVQDSIKRKYLIRL